MKTFEGYLKDNAEKGIIDFRIRANGNEFYIYPFGKNGETLDFAVIGNSLKMKHNGEVVGCYCGCGQTPCMEA